jgi:uncharacterized protein YjiS (DUF1127 family)
MKHYPYYRVAPHAAGGPQGLFAAFRRWRRERAMASALLALDDATLKDLGIYRCEIPTIARTQCGG